MNGGLAAFGRVPELGQDARRGHRRLDRGRVRGTRDAGALGAESPGHLVLLGGRPGVVVLAVDDHDRQARRRGGLGQLIGAVRAVSRYRAMHDEMDRAGPQRPLAQERDDVVVGAIGPGLRLKLRRARTA